MKRKVIHILIVAGWVLAIAASITGLAFANRWQDQATCRALLIHIDKGNAYPLISEKEIRAIVDKEWGKAIGKPLQELNFRALEEELRSVPVIESADVYASLSGIAEIKVVQRKPVMKLFFSQGGNWYIDGLGYFFPVSPGYSVRVLPVSGNIPFRVGKYFRLQNMPETYAGRQAALSLFEAGLYIHSHRLLHSLVAQIYYNEQGEVELIPATGDHTVLLGDFSDLQWRLDNLLLFYTRTAGRIDYRRYPVINLKYRNQIILTQK